MSTRAPAKPKPRKQPRQITADICEELVRGAKAHKVDRERGVILGVKVVGRESVNTHGVQGVDGSEYTAEALETSKPLYEGLKVNIDHPPRKEPGKERSSYDRLGKLVNVRVEAGELYADLELLKAHPMAERLMEAAERMPDAFALSHNALGKGDVENRKFVITSIPEVRSVDIVADGGTNTSLFESKNMAKKTTVRKLLERLSKDGKAFDLARRKRLKSLLEDDGEGLDAEMTEADDEGGDHRDHLYEAMKACQEAGDDEMAGKIHGLLKPKKAEAQEDDEEEAESQEDDESDGEEKETPEDDEAEYAEPSDGDKKPARESREVRAELRRLKDDLAVRDLCESLDFRPTATQKKALLALKTAADRKALIQESKGTGRSNAPRSSGQSIRPVRESAVPKTAEDQAALLLR